MLPLKSASAFAVSVILLGLSVVETPSLLAQVATQSTRSVQSITTNYTELFVPKSTLEILEILDGNAAEGVTPDRNAAIDLLKIVGPSFLDEFKDRERFWQKLGMDPLDANESYLISESKFRTSLNKAAREQFSNEIYSAKLQDWSIDSNPAISSWIHENRQALDRVEAAVSKPRFYLPIIYLAKNGNAAPLIDKEIESLAESLQFRAYQKFSAGKFDGAINDFVTALKLARLVAQQPVVNLERSIIRCEYIGLRGLIGMALSDQLDESQLEKIYAKVAELGPLDTNRIFNANKLRCEQSLAHRVWTGEEKSLALLLDFRKLIVKNALELNSKTELSKLQVVYASIFDDMLDRLLKIALRGIGTQIVNRTLARKCHNQLLADYVEAYNQPTLAGSVRCLSEIELRLATRIRAQYSVMNILKLTRSPLCFRDYCSERMSLCEQYALHRMHIDKFTLQQNCRFDFHAAQIACLLMLHREKHGQFPQSLNELAASRESSDWIDPFDDEPIRFKATQDSFALYSIGTNLKDDQGEKNYSDQTDDWGIAFPYEEPE